MEDRTSTGHTVQATKTSFSIIEYIQEQDGARVHEIADALEMANSTAHKHLTTLEQIGYVVKRDAEYRLGMEFLFLGGYVQNSNSIYKPVKPVVRKLANRTGEQAQFIVEENGLGYHLFTAPGDQAVSIDTRIGKRIYLHANSAGKAMMAFWEQSRVDDVLDKWGLPPITENTITDRDEFIERLSTVRQRGYALNMEEHIIGYRGIAAPVRIQNQDVIGALAIGGPSHRYKREQLNEELPEIMLEAANELQLTLEFS